MHAAQTQSGCDVALDRDSARRALRLARGLRERAARRGRALVAVALLSVAVGSSFLVLAFRGTAGPDPRLLVATLGLAAVAAVATLGSRRSRRLELSMVPEIRVLEAVFEALDHEHGPALIMVPREEVLRALRVPAGRARRWQWSWARAVLRPAAAVLAIAAAVAAVTAVGRMDARTARVDRWSFTEDVVDPALLGLSMGPDVSGSWRLEHHQDATGARALVNLAGAPDAPPAVALTDTVGRDVRVSTRCKPSPRLPQRACGLVFRWASEEHHYLARVDAAAERVELAVVIAGQERVLSSALHRVEPASWHDLAVAARGDRLTVTLDGRVAIDVHDPSLPNAGRAGLWSPPEGIVHFDELTVGNLEPLPHSSDLIPFLLWTGEGAAG